MLQSKTDEVLPTPQADFWHKYFEYIFVDTNVTVDIKKDRLFITDSDLGFLQSIIPYIEATPLVNIELYLWWNAVYAMIMSTSTALADYIDKQLDLLFQSKPNFIARSR